MKKAILVDIDGTLANIEHRRHFVTKYKLPCKCGCKETTLMLTDCGEKLVESCEKCLCDTEHNKPDWLSFNKSMVMDTPNEWCVEILQRMSEPPNGYNIVFVTGREEEHCAQVRYCIKCGKRQSKRCLW